jgi:hypothetical protein
MRWDCPLGENVSRELKSVLLAVLARSFVEADLLENEQSTTAV